MDLHHSYRCNQCRLFGMCLGEEPRQLAWETVVCNHCSKIFWKYTGKRLGLLSDEACMTFLTAVSRPWSIQSEQHGSRYSFWAKLNSKRVRTHESIVLNWVCNDPHCVRKELDHIAFWQMNNSHIKQVCIGHTLVKEIRGVNCDLLRV